MLWRSKSIVLFYFKIFIRSTTMTCRTERRKGIRSNQKNIRSKRRRQGNNTQPMKTLVRSGNHWTNLRWFLFLGVSAKEMIFFWQIRCKATWQLNGAIQGGNKRRERAITVITHADREKKVKGILLLSCTASITACQ